MGRIKDVIKKLRDKISSFPKGVKISLIIAVVAILVGVVTFSYYSSKNKYGVLFSNLESEDAATVTTKLKDGKVDYKVSGQSILVPKAQVDELRLQLASQISTGSKGYELMDTASSFGRTDEEFQVEKVRMAQGELEKTIKGFPQIAAARVHISPAEDSVFVKDKTPGKAAVYIKLNPGTKLDTDQVRSIVALVSGSTENIPQENIQVIDDKMNLLSKDLFVDGQDTASSASVEKQSNLEKEYEAKLEKAIVDLYEPVIGKGKVTAKVSVDLDFDSKTKTQTIVDPNKVIVSQQTSKETNTNNGGTSSSSPVDNNMSNTISNTNGSTTSTKDSQTTNYEVGKTENKVISAPGEVKRLTASVMVDGKLDAQTQQQLSDSIGNAIGLDKARGDQISVLGMNFDPAAKDQAQAELDAMQKEIDSQNRMKLIKVVAVIAAIVLVLVGGLIFFLRKRRKNKVEEQEHLLDIVVGEDAIPHKEPISFAPLDFEPNDENTHIQNEVRKYAKEKPDQVVDVVKSWLTESERG